MKYGIQIVEADGTVRYAYSAKSGRPTFTDDLTEAALFVQEASAIKAVRRIRLDGYEGDKCELSVIAVKSVVEHVIEVPRPAKKAGYIMSMTIKSGSGATSTVYYTASKKGEVCYRQSDIYYGWGGQTRATVFADEAKARARLEQLIQFQVDTEVRCRESLAAVVHHREWEQQRLDKALEQQEFYKSVEFEAVS